MSFALSLIAFITLGVMVFSIRDAWAGNPSAAVASFIFAIVVLSFSYAAGRYER